jgi:hypothetical protein
LEGQRLEKKTAAWRFFISSLPSRGGTMKRFLIFLSFLLVLIPSVAGTALAVSPMPEEIGKNAEKKAIEKVKVGENDATCSIKITYAGDLREDYSASIVLEGSLPKKDALEKTIGLHEDRLKKEDISKVNIECKFPKLKSKEQ